MKIDKENSVEWIEKDSCYCFGYLDKEHVCLIKFENDKYRIYTNYLDFDGPISKPFETLEKAKKYFQEVFIINMQKRLQDVR